MSIPDVGYGPRATGSGRWLAVLALLAACVLVGVIASLLGWLNGVALLSWVEHFAAEWGFLGVRS